MMLHQNIFIKLLLCILLLAQACHALMVPSGDALELNGNVKVVLPEFRFGGPFTIEIWAMANFTIRSGPLLFFGNEIEGSIDDSVELGIDINGVLYLNVAVSDEAAFRARVPTKPAELAHILPHLSTNPSLLPLTRRIQTTLDPALSGQWALIHVKGDSHGIISIYVNKVLAVQTSSLDIPVLPAFLTRTVNLIGASPSEHYVGIVQVVSLWSRALAERDITGFTQKVNDRGLIGRWDFSYVREGVVLNQAADDNYIVQQKTATLQSQLATLQKRIEAAEEALADAKATGNADDVASAEKALSAARLAVDQAKHVSSNTRVGVSVANVAPAKNQDLVNNIRAAANSPSVWDNTQTVAAQIAEFTGATQERTANTLNDLAHIASQDVSDSDLYLKAGLETASRLPFKATNVNARPSIKTSVVAPSITVSNAGSIEQRIDGTIVEGGGRKRWLWPLFLFFYKLIFKCRPEDLDMRCTWSNDPHYVSKPANGSWEYRFDYHSPSCHYILKVGEDVLIQEQSYQCGSAGCISKVGAYVAGKYVVIFDSNGKVTVNGVPVSIPHTLEKDIIITSKNRNAPTLVVEGIFELFFSGSASLKFTSQQYYLADRRSICTQRRTGNVLPWSQYDLQPSECFLGTNWEPPTSQCDDYCKNGKAKYDLEAGCSCDCYNGWQGPTCDTFHCDQCAAPSGNCTGPSQCTCETNDPLFVFGGSSCQYRCARDHCSNGGTVSVTASGTCACACPDGFSGATCENHRCPLGENKYLCSNLGTCHTNGTCECIPNVSFGVDCGGNCTAQVCATDASGITCAGHGSCVCGSCVCNAGFSGANCSVADCTNVTSIPDPKGCGDQGACVGDTGVPSCSCKPGWSGARCEVFTCTPICSANGNCTAANPPFCDCKLGWTGAACSDITCNFLSHCHTPKGTCMLGEGEKTPKCQCKEHWTGRDCRTPLCLNSCSNQGACVDSPSNSDAPPTCECSPPWIGDDCSQLPDCEVDLAAGNWSSPEWQARATAICSNTSFISAAFYENCLFDAQQIDNYEVLYSLAYHSYLECEDAQAAGVGPNCGILCPNFCNFNGICSPEGVCQCDPGFYGADCSMQPDGRAFLFQYDGQQQESVINQVVQPAAPRTFLNVDKFGATATTNEVANSAVVFLYQDYRPKYGQCVPYNNLYLAVLLDRSTSTCENGNLKFAVSLNDSSINVQEVITHKCTSTKTTSGYSFGCAWRQGENAAVILGPLPQNLSWAIDLTIPTGDTCITSVYYGSEALTGTTDLVPIPISQAGQVRVVSEIRNSKCGTINSCTSCMEADGCGWCPELGYCMDGTASGPSHGTCSVWRYSTEVAESRVVATSGYGNPVIPSNVDVYLVDDSYLDVYAYVVFPATSVSISTMFLVDLSSGMNDIVASFGLQAATLFSAIGQAYPGSQVALSAFVDKPVAPYGSESQSDYVYVEYQHMTTDSTVFSNAARSLKLGNGHVDVDPANAQLEALLHTAIRSSSGFTGSHRVVTVITGTPFHVPVGWSKPNNLDTIIDADEDYPSISNVRDALISANIVPLFLVTGDQALYSNYSALVGQLGFGHVLRVTKDSITEQVTAGLQEVFSTATLVSTSPKFIKSIFPPVYKSIQRQSRVKFTVRLDRSVVKRAELFDSTATLVAPGFGYVNVRLAKSDLPVGVPIPEIIMKQNTETIIYLKGSNIYNTPLTYLVASLPGNGTLLQYEKREPITVPGTEITDANHRVIYVPAPGGSCQHAASDYCSRRRQCYNPCPYATFQFQLVDSCAVKSSFVDVSINVIADLTNNRPVAKLDVQPRTMQDTDLPIFLDGYDKDNDTLSSIITSLPTNGGLYHLNTKLTATMLPFNVSGRTIVYRPPYRRWGENYDQFTYYVNDGKKAYQMGDSDPHTVSIEVVLTDHAPVVQDVPVPPVNEGTASVDIQLVVTDEDAIDFQRGEVKIFIRSVPTPAQGVLKNMNNKVIAKDDEVSDTTNWRVKFEPATYGVFTFTYQAYDGQLFSDVATVTITIKFVNQYPTSQSTTVSTNEDTPIMLTFPGFDRENDPIIWRIPDVPTAYGTFYDVANGNKTMQRLYNLTSGYALFVPTYKETIGFRLFYTVTNKDGYGNTNNNYYIQIFILNVNDAPVVKVAQPEYALTVAESAGTSVTLNNIQLSDADNPTADFSVSIELVGDGSISFANSPSNLNNRASSATSITFTSKMRDLNSALAGLTYNVVSQPGIQSYKGTVIITANDNDNNEPKTGSGQVVIRTTVVADTSNLAATASAVGAGAAATVGLAVMYHWMKVKHVLPEGSSPTALDEDAVDVVLENPLYRHPGSHNVA